MINSNSFQPLEYEVLLSQHSNNTSNALIALLSDHNELLRNHKALQLENTQLWKTLKSSSSRGNEGVSAAGKDNSSRGASNSSSSSAISNPTLRKAFIETSAANNVGSQQLQLPLSDNQLTDSNGTTSPRKGASLDLARPRFRDPSPTRSTIIPSSSTTTTRSNNDLPTSSSMPVLNHTTESTDPNIRYLPQITPISPMDLISPNSRPSPVPSPSHSSLEQTESNASSNHNAIPESNQQSLPLPSFPSSPSKLPSLISPLSPPPSSSDSLIDPTFEQQRNHQSDQQKLQASQSNTFNQSNSESSRRPILSPSSLPFCSIAVESSNIKLTEKGKETVSFIIEVSIISSTLSNSTIEEVNNKVGWKLEKLYSEIVKLDSLIRSKINRQELKTLRPLPDKSFFKDHSPYKSDQRKSSIERYLQGLTTITSVDQMIICAFFNSDFLVESLSINSSTGMEGWLSKRGRSFGGWQTRYYVLSFGSLSYYDAREGVKLGEINISQASIGRQSSRSTDIVNDDSYLHSFLIRTVRTLDDQDQDADHILCAENDDLRDAWVSALTTIQAEPQQQQQHQQHLQRPVLSTLPSFDIPPAPLRTTEAADNRKHNRKQSISSITSLHDSIDHHHQSGVRRAASSELPHSSSTNNSNFIGIQNIPEKRSTSELGYYLQQQQQQAEDQRLSAPNPNKLQSQSISRGSDPRQQVPRPITPEPRKSESGSAPKIAPSDVSGPMNAVPLPSGYQFKPDPNSNANNRSKKTKSSFWNFSSRGNHTAEKTSTPAAPPPPSRPVFGVPLKEAVNISRIRAGLELPAVVYRCVEYLEAKNAELEEGIYRLSGSSNAIKTLKDRFNAESDVNLLASPVYYDCHCIAGLLKLYFRELPDHLLTRELHPEFIKVIELRERNDRVQALTRLVARLPIENYTVFRFFFAHLCSIAQNEKSSKMGLRNLGIVFSPTLAMPAPLFSLLLSEFDTVFAVEQASSDTSPNPATTTEEITSVSSGTSRPRPNSVIYTASNANHLMETGNQRLIRQDEDDEESHILEDYNGEDELLPHPQRFDNRSPANSSPSPSSIHTPRSDTITIPSSPRPGTNFFSTN